MGLLSYKQKINSKLQVRIYRIQNTYKERVALRRMENVQPTVLRKSHIP